MFSKKTMQVTALILLIGAALVVSVIQLRGRQAVAEPSPQGPQGSGPGSSTIPTASGLPAATGTIAFSEDFSGSNKSMPQGWHRLTDASSTWVDNEGRLEQWGDADQLATDNAVTLVTDDTSFGDGIYEAQVFPMSGEPVGMVFRGSDAGYYRLSLSPNLANNAPKAKLEKVASDGSSTTLATNTTWPGYAFEQWQRMEIGATGGHITVSVGSTQLFDVNDSSLSSGWVGVWTIADRGAAFDTVRVQSAAGR